MKDLKILVVDDNPGSSNPGAKSLATARIGLAGHSVIAEVRRAADALSAVESKRPHLVFMELEFGDGARGGAELARTIYLQYNVPTLFSTQNASIDLFDTSFGLGAYGIVYWHYDDLWLKQALNMAYWNFLCEEQTTGHIRLGVNNDGKLYQILGANLRAHSVLGSHLVGRSLDEILKTNEEWRKRLQPIVDGKPTARFELTLSDEGGSKRVYQFEAQAIIFRESPRKPDTVKGWSILGTDVTESVKRSNMERKLVQAQRESGAAVGTIFFAHDLRARLQLLSMEPSQEGNETVAEFGDRFYKRVQLVTEDALRMLENALRRARGESTPFEVFDLGTLLVDLDRTMPSLRSRMLPLRPKVEIIIESGKSDSPKNSLIKGDKIALLNSIVNLIYNAVRHTEEGQVVVSYDERKDRDDAPPLNQRMWIVIEVKDDGRGITEEKWNSIFDAPDRHGAGDLNYGLGLASVKQVVDDHAGQLRCTSPVNIQGSGKDRGTKIEILLPRAAAPAEA